jgi:hypothetical protein
MAKHRSLFPLIVSAVGLLGACSGGGDERTPRPTYTLIDDMEGTDGDVIDWVPPGGAMAGIWWTATDCTQADRIAPPPSAVEPTGGWSYDLLPEPHETFPGITSQHTARLRATTPLSAGIWGAAMGVNLLASTINAGVPWPSPAVGPGCTNVSFSTFTTQAADLSAYAGITFWGRAGRGGLSTVRVLIQDLHTDPQGGFCNAADPTTDAGCYNHFRTKVRLTDSFAQYTVDFSTLVQDASWGVRPNPSVPDLQHVYAITFAVDLSDCAASSDQMCAGGETQTFPFDLQIDDLYFVNRTP